jgi:hypothetical protein
MQLNKHIPIDPSKARFLSLPRQASFWIVETPEFDEAFTLTKHPLPESQTVQIIVNVKHQPNRQK